MKKLLVLILPTPSVAIALLALPLTSTTYFLFTQYSNKFIAEQSVDYFDIQNELVRKILFENSLAAGFNRFSDFLFWGILAAIIIVISWFIGVVKTTASNHSAVETFNNFQTDNASWNRSFAVKVIIKVLLVLIALYSLIRILSTYIPEISAAIGAQLREGSKENLINIFLANAVVYVSLLVIVVSYKIFRHISVE